MSHGPRVEVSMSRTFFAAAIALAAVVAAAVAILVTWSLVGGEDCSVKEAEGFELEEAAILFPPDQGPEPELAPEDVEPELEDVELDQLTAAVVRLQPRRFAVGDPRARQIASLVRDAAVRFGQDPYVALAIARRESDFDPRVGSGEIVGGLGERGYFQIFPNGAAEKLCGGCDQTEPICNAHTAMCWLSLRQEECGTDPWVYVGAYGRKKCPRKWQARGWREVRRARIFYCLAKGSGCEDHWPLR